MIDTLKSRLPDARRLDMAGRLGLGGRRYALVTLHRPSNVDDPAVLGTLLRLFGDLSRVVPLVFPARAWATVSAMPSPNSPTNW